MVSGLIIILKKGTTADKVITSEIALNTIKKNKEYIDNFFLEGIYLYNFIINDRDDILFIFVNLIKLSDVILTIPKKKVKVIF